MQFVFIVYILCSLVPQKGIAGDLAQDGGSTPGFDLESYEMHKVMGMPRFRLWSKEEPGAERVLNYWSKLIGQKHLAQIYYQGQIPEKISSTYETFSRFLLYTYLIELKKEYPFEDGEHAPEFLIFWEHLTGKTLNLHMDLSDRDLAEITQDIFPTRIEEIEHFVRAGKDYRRELVLDEVIVLMYQARLRGDQLKTQNEGLWELLAHTGSPQEKFEALLLNEDARKYLEGMGVAEKDVDLERVMSLINKEVARGDKLKTLFDTRVRELERNFLGWQFGRIYTDLSAWSASIGMVFLEKGAYHLIQPEYWKLDSSGGIDTAFSSMLLSYMITTVGFPFVDKIEAHSEKIPNPKPIQRGLLTGVVAGTCAIAFRQLFF